MCTISATQSMKMYWCLANINTLAKNRVFFYHLSALGHQGTHPTPLEAMQRLRVLLLGKGDFIDVQNPSVELEPGDSDFSPAEAAEHLERQKSIEEEVIVSQDVTSDCILGANEDLTAHLEVLEDLETIYLTQKDIDEKLKSNSFQVSETIYLKSFKPR